MLFVGPPRILITGVPDSLKELVRVGCSTIMGIGALASTRPQVEKVRTSLLVPPLNRPKKNVWTWSVISTRINGLGAILFGGFATPITEVGKLTLTELPGEAPSLL